jgi:hypothetical protein
MEMQYQDQINGMLIPGSVYHKILHISEAARYNFLVGVKQMVPDPDGQCEFWKESWKYRDINAEKIKNAGERLKFMKECCTGEVDHLLWIERWKRIDQNDSTYASSDERAEHFDYQVQEIPKQKPVCIRDRLKKMGLLKGEPNFNKDAYVEFHKSIQMSRL